MREEPYNWDQYHTAWQQYYHQYFYRYYAGWWQQQKEQLPAQNTAAQTSDVILTVENEQQAWARISKGRDGAEVAVEMAGLLRRLDQHSA